MTASEAKSPDPEFEFCGHSVGVAGHLYSCRLPAGHRFQHRARVDGDVRDVFDRCAEIVWPNR